MYRSYIFLLSRHYLQYSSSAVVTVTGASTEGSGASALCIAPCCHCCGGWRHCCGASILAAQHNVSPLHGELLVCMTSWALCRHEGARDPVEGALEPLEGTALGQEPSLGDVAAEAVEASRAHARRGLAAERLRARLVHLRTCAVRGRDWPYLFPYQPNFKNWSFLGAPFASHIFSASLFQCLSCIRSLSDWLLITQRRMAIPQ